MSLAVTCVVPASLMSPWGIFDELKGETQGMPLPGD